MAMRPLLLNHDPADFGQPRAHETYDLTPLTICLLRSSKQLTAPGGGRYRQCSHCNGRPKLAILSEDLAETETGVRSGILRLGQKLKHLLILWATFEMKNSW
eukprot:scaffold15417_cov71-Cyclotella_meneghiniana.AAC.10